VSVQLSWSCTGSPKMAIADEETMDEQDKGHLSYQESKVFHAEPHLCSVYDNSKRRMVTFEVYGLDTQDMLHRQYTYQEFDGLFRFNAELMNPNRKEGRYHWVIERLEIAQVGQERKVRLAAEVTKEVPELPIYETTRKIPTGRMDLKERQRLREQMDMLSIKREEKIRAKKQLSKKKFLEHIFFLQEETKRKEKEQEESIASEREKRWQDQLKFDNEEEEQAAKDLVLARSRRIAVESKEQAHEEREEEDLRQLRLRWKAADAEKARLISEARARKEKDEAARKAAAIQAAAQAKTVQNKREVAWGGRDKRVQAKRDALVNKALALIPELKRLANLTVERNTEYLQDWNDQRWPVFEAQLERMRYREAQRQAEADAVKNYIDNRAIPTKTKTKGKKAKAKGHGKKGDKHKGGKEKDGKEEGAETKEAAKDEAKDAKKETERVVDGVEAKMREQMAEVKRRQEVDQKRIMKIEERAEKIKQHELKRIADYKLKVATQQANKQNAANERMLILSTKQDEKLKAEERQRGEDERLKNVRAKHVLAWEQKQLEWLQTH